MWKTLFLCAGLLIVSGCVANESPRPEAPADAPAATTDIPFNMDPDDIHTLSAELTTYEGGSAGARAFVSMQAQKICEAMGKQIDIEDITSQTTWRGGSATVSFYCR